MLRPRCALGTAPTLREMATTFSSTLTDGQRQAYAEDGVVHVPGAVDADLLAGIEALVDRQLADPGPWVTDTGPEAAATALRYSMRMPEMARLITNCWICSVPSKMSWILASRCHRSTGYSRV